LEFQVYTVSQLTRELKELIEGTFPPVWVEGEVSNFVHHGSGHMYFSLKDEGASLRCVFFRQYNRLLQFHPENGMKMLARGLLSVYEASGQYQLMVGELRPSGMGALQLAFEQLKARLQAEGLFDEERKRPIPSVPRTIGVVTSPTGAAIRDIISVISRRFPPARIVLCPVRVQGEGAAREIAGGIRAFGRWGGADVLIVGRGGGSLEDLWAFNEEEVARAIFESPVPVISAVGHQTDFTIADLVADLRAPTPSAAAEYAVPEAAELTGRLEGLGERLARAERSFLEAWAQRLDDLERGLFPSRLLACLRQQETARQNLAGRLRRAAGAVLAVRVQRWMTLREQLSALNPAAVLGRGFSIVRTPAGTVVRDADRVVPGDSLEVILSRGLLGCRVETVRPGLEEIKTPSLPEAFRSVIQSQDPE
jgi:exodeoxyribonuclease VII large subunit